MNNNLTLSVTLTGDGKQLSGTLKDAQGDVREFSATTERESKKAETALTAPGRSATTVSEHLRETQREARAVGTETAQGSREANQALAQTGQQAQTTTGHFNQLRRIAGLAAGAFSVRQISKMADGWSDMQSVVGAAIGDMSAAGDMMERITDIANASYAPLEQTARTYASNVSALRDLGRTAADTADYTESLNHHLVLTATRGQQAESVQNALSRAMAVGRLQADGLETVLANGGEVAESLANQLGVTVSQLRGLATEGRITGDVIASALIGSLDDVRDRAGEMPATIEDGFVRIGTSATRLVGELDQAMGVSEGVAGILIGAADAISATIDPLIRNIDTLQSGITIVGAAAGAYVTYRSVLIAATAAQWAFNTAVRANPLGLAITLLGAAAGALITYRQEVTLAGRESFQTTLDVDGLTSSFRGLTEAQQENRRASIVGDLIEMRMEAGKLGAELVEVSRLVRNSGQLTPEGGALPIASADDIARGRELREELGTILANIGAGTDLLNEYDSIMSDLGQTTSGTATRTRELADASKASSKAAREAAAAAKQLTDATIAQAAAIEALRNRLVPHRRETVQLVQDQNTLNLAFAMGRITASEYLYMIGALQTVYIDAQKDTDDLADKTVKAAYTMEGAWDELRLNGLRRLDDGFADLWLGAVDGSRNATDTIKRMWDQTLAELLHMAMTRPITVQLAASMGFGGGANAAAGAASSGGFGINPMSLGNAWQSLQGGLGGIQWGGVPTGYSGGWAGSATAGMGASGGTSFMGGSLRNFSGMQGLAGLGAGFAGNYLGGQLFGQGRHSNTLGTVGGLAGTYLGGPIGALLGSGLGSALGGLFGGRSWNETGSGVNLGVSSGNITGNQFSDQHSKGGLFRSSRRRTQTSGLDGEFSGALQQVYDATEASLAATIEVLGFQSSALTGFTTGLARIDTKGLSAEDAEARIQEWLSNTLNALAIHSVGDVSQYALGGETTIETVERLAVALGSLNPILEQLHGSTLAASMAGGSAASHLAELAGGIDAFSARADYYYQNVLTETERQERAMRAAAQAMGAFTARTGQVIESTDALRDLVDGIDLTTAAGRELYNEAMNLAPALVEIERGLERVGQRFDQMLQDAESAFADAEAQARRAWQAFDNQAFSQQITLLGLLGDSESALALERERELATIDESLRPTQERIWAIQDEIAAQQNATQAARNYQRELTRVRDQLNQSLANVGTWLDQQLATSGTPESNLATAQEQLARQLVLAESGDRNALQNITQYAQQVLDANRDYNASSAAGQRIQQDVYDAIAGLPAAINAEQYLADEIRTALFDALEGKATDSEIKSLMASVADGDMTIEAALKQVYGASQGTEANTDSLEKQARDQLKELNGLVSEMTRTTDQFVGLNSTMLSLRDAIIALGVAQDDIARIEEERAAAEQAERDRISNERTVSQYTAAASSHMAQSVDAIGRAQQGVDAIGLGGQEIGEISKLIERYAGDDGLLQSSEYGTLRDTVESMDPGHYRGVARTLALAARHASLASFAERDAANVGLTGDDRVDAQGVNFWELWQEHLRFQSVDGSHRTGLEYVPFDGYVAELHRGEKVLTAEDADAMRNVSRPQLPPTPAPNFPLLGNNDIVETLRDLKRENQQLRADLSRLLERISDNTHGTANAVASSAQVAERQRQAQLEEQRAATRASRIKGRVL